MRLRIYSRSVLSDVVRPLKRPNLPRRRRLRPPQSDSSSGTSTKLFGGARLSEGGVESFIEANHEAVIELSRRGIMNSICSKNDEASTLEIIRKLGLSDYFVFPSISWTAKGPRVRAIIEDMGLRPENVMFIDDNIANRREVAALVPGIQVEDETICELFLADPRFRGKSDPDFTRLAQYKLLERKARDRAKATDGVEDFLRSCDIRVTIDYEIEANIDRAVELINRTNQLNFTKSRLPEQPGWAGRKLLRNCRAHTRHAGLVRVSDRYGDYGYVGFFLSVSGRETFTPGDVAAPASALLLFLPNDGHGHRAFRLRTSRPARIDRRAAGRHRSVRADGDRLDQDRRARRQRIASNSSRRKSGRSAAAR